MAERTGRSAITAVVMTALDESDERLAFKLPPVDGFKPRIHTRCYRKHYFFYKPIATCHYIILRSAFLKILV